MIFSLTCPAYLSLLVPRMSTLKPLLFVSLYPVIVVGGACSFGILGVALCAILPSSIQWVIGLYLVVLRQGQVMLHERLLHWALPHTMWTSEYIIIVCHAQITLTVSCVVILGSASTTIFTQAWIIICEVGASILKGVELWSGKPLFRFLLAKSGTGKANCTEEDFRRMAGQSFALNEWVEAFGPLVYLAIVNVVAHGPNAHSIAGMQGSDHYGTLFPAMDLARLTRCVAVMALCDLVIVFLTFTLFARYLRRPLFHYLLCELDAHGHRLVGPFFALFVNSICSLHLHCGNDPTFAFAWKPFR
eukprot:NODE_7495_length_1573_cov_7.739972.p1 GENE.NODE_7495_length_1573_cov_7.739972~~NODE_7495_length_1573_cov_7.739972.p1  ORF type:complete len:303 (+),score=32.16 NODE_7495_length_1573_cov_7.739972:219-1127(+)